MDETRFNVASQDVDAAVGWLAERGFAPCRIEHGEGEAVLVFPAMADDRLHELVTALPVHLCNKVGVLVGDRPPFRAPIDTR